MKPKKQLALGTVLLAVTAAACVNLAKWAGKKIEERTKKKEVIFIAHRGTGASPVPRVFYFLRRSPNTSSADT